MRLNGWQRLWVVVSLVWISAIAVAGYLSRPTDEFAPHHPAFHYQLTPASRALLLDPDSTASAAEVQMPNGHILRFHLDSSRENQERVAREYHQITIEAQSSARIENIKFFALLAFIPCFALGLIGFGFAWIRRGFKESNRAEP